MEPNPEQVELACAADERVRYRLWLVSRRRDWDGPWDAVPPGAIAVAPLFSEAFPLPSALAVCQSRNTSLERRVDTDWVIAVPVRIQYVGDLVPGHFAARGMGKRVGKRPG